MGPGNKDPIELKNGIWKHIAKGVDVNDVAMLCGAEPREVLQIISNNKIPAILSYSSKGKWHVAKVRLTELGANKFNVEIVPAKRPYPINVKPNQSVGLSIKYGYGKLILETKVLTLEPSPNPNGRGIVVLAMPDKIDLVPRRNYFRVEVPRALKVNAQLWHRCCEADSNQTPPENSWQGKLVDISASGAQVAIDAEQKPDLRKGQFIGLRFAPLPYEDPLTFNAVIRNILPTADNKRFCIGLQMVGLESSPKGRQKLHQLCKVVEQYYQINQSNAKLQDFQTTKLTEKPVF